jgi:hypothetical protein
MRHTLESNPVRAFVARIIVGIVGGVLVFVALPAVPYDSWWAASSPVPLVLGGVLLAFAFLAPTRWCEVLAQII